MNPQDKAILAIAAGSVFIRTDDGNAVALTVKAAKLVAENLGDAIKIAERLKYNVPSLENRN